MLDSVREYRLELRHLRAFVAIADELHFGRAASNLHLAQPALTKQIQQLESTLGVRLLNRSSRAVTLTSAGEAVLSDARRTLDEARRVVDVASRAARGETGLLRIGFSASAPLGPFPHVIRSFRERYPDVQLELTELWSADQVEALLTDRLDLGFANQPAIRSDLLETHLLQEHPVIAAVPASMPLARRRQVDLRDLADEPFIGFPRSMAPEYFDQLLAACQRAGFSPRIAQEVREILATIALVAAGFGVALLPATVRTVRREGVAYLGIRDPVPVTNTVIAWRRSDSSQVLERFLDVARETDSPVG